MIKRIKSLGFFVLGMGLLGLLQSCGAASEGFNAPSGSSISGSASATVPVDGGGTTEIYTVTVKVADTTGGTRPGNGIQVVLRCEFCTFMDTDPRGSVFTSPLGELVEVTDDPYIIKTGDSGTYKVGVRLAPPSNFGKTTYPAKVTADIGEVKATTIYTVTAF